MGYPLGDGVSNGMSGNYIPEIWSGKLLEKFYEATVFAQISNTDYEGEISAHGDKVKIRTTPDILIKDYKIGIDLQYDRYNAEVVELRIDQGKYFAFGINKVEEKQADINYVDKWAEDASEQMKIAIDRDILTAIPPDAGTDNAGDKAGKLVKNIDLGKTGAPVQVAKDTIVDKIVECGQVLTEQNRPITDRWMVIPAWCSTRIKISELKDASLSGDGKSTLRSGLIGGIDHFKLYESNNLAPITDGEFNCFNVMFGHKSALTFASQLTENETIPNPKDFGKLMRGLQVYGYEVIQPDSMGTMYCRAA